MCSDKVKKIIIGTAQFGMSYGITNRKGLVSNDEVANILSMASINGIRGIDTAMAYGTSESVLGDHFLERFDVVTKIPEVPSNVKDIKGWIISQVDQSMKKTRLTSYAGILLHAPQQLFSSIGSEIIMGLNEVLRNGWTQKIGVSVYEIEDAMRCCSVMDVNLIQLPINLLDGRVSSGNLSVFKKMGVEIHARSIYLQGLLLFKFKLPKKFSQWSRHFDLIQQWIIANKLTPLEACLGYVSGLKEVDKFILGLESSDQLCEALSSLGSEVLIPSELQIKDDQLLNPFNWNKL